jgi:hypothetical protein
MQMNQVNARSFAEEGLVGSNIIRRVEVWGYTPNYQSAAGGDLPVTLCRDSTGYLYQVLGQSGMGTSNPQVGEIWLINRSLGLWTFMARLAIPSPIVQLLSDTTQQYAMVPSNRFVFGSVPNGKSWSVKFPNPITGVQGEIYGFRNSNGGGTGYNGILNLAAFASETIHGPTSFGAHSGASFVTDNIGWWCVGDTTASGDSEIGGS